jgi:hypothetical protein
LSGSGVRLDACIVDHSRELAAAGVDKPI